ncbi:LysR substrate-binding domain-containing protein [Achromobacter xylosoxidans]|jgi:DNA-binding transcriptional LysR family regulator|uniref:LysR substrate-binding domain-containing protein n=1 Tax=Alcaligenes xylosoxydans xylosoxydans TaxID=85698 RepID=A0A9P1W7A7_ALCXX|nr:LysR substrate-binding domain-containing protein [Achromobacter xylosoxidans]AMH05005.1 LysR family transcriptional regulator [Achromobacter xylosoxidans]EFV84427.1 LysR family Transcriptional regulator [Achromobacter xylosoxidans C54]KAA5923120.1 LysR family transcriptional regulator [Achromobacter xylosoxidans]MBK1982120.1 LysR family transcriptional regulator [Achromobacter xylosoxidans]MCH1995224.1 LysR substrate-binding domain-containing protein [Achromobacter xylosoxidans]
MKTTLDEMQVFIAIVDCGSITAAADALQQTISATSRTMTRLEEKLQTTLMRRTTRRLELTEEGSAYLEQARKIIAAVEETEEQMRARRNQPAGRLRVDAASPFMLHVIVPLVPGYRQRYPKVELELNSNEGNIDLLERRTDLALRIGSLKDSSLHAVPIGRSRVRVLASPGYLAAHGTPKRAADLREHTLLGFSQLESLNEWPLEDADGQPLHIQPSIRSFSGETLRQLALNDAGIVCLSDFMTRADRQSGALRQLFPRQTLDVRQPVNAVYYRNTAISSRIKSFIDYLVESLGPRGFDE